MVNEFSGFGAYERRTVASGNKRSPMPSSRTLSSAAEPRAAGIDDREAGEMARFLVRIFGDEAASVAAERAVKSDQAADWERVGLAIAKLLAAEELSDEGGPLRLFR